MGEVVIGDCIHHSDHEVIELQIIGNMRKTASKTSTLAVGRADFGLLTELVSKIPWESAFEHLGVCEYWSLFQSHLLRAQEQAVPKCWKSNQWGTVLASLNRYLLLELEQKRQVCGCWKQGQVTREDYREAVCHCSEKICVAKPPGRGHPQLLWETCPTVSPPSW